MLYLSLVQNVRSQILWVICKDWNGLMCILSAFYRLLSIIDLPEHESVDFNSLNVNWHFSYSISSASLRFSWSEKLWLRHMTSDPHYSAWSVKGHSHKINDLTTLKRKWNTVQVELKLTKYLSVNQFKSLLDNKDVIFLLYT